MKRDIYNIYTKYYIAVDCVIFGYADDELKVLLHPRRFEPSAGKWSLLGGFVMPAETLDDAARRVLFDTTGLEYIYQEQVYAFSRLKRDPAGRVISVAYYALIRIDQQDSELLKAHGAQWWPVSNLPELIFDHHEMVTYSLVSLQKKAGSELIGSELLGDVFTISNLKKLYEAIFQRDLDAGNFRKKVLSLNFMQNTGIKDKNDSKKGSFLYKYKTENKEELKLNSHIK